MQNTRVDYGRVENWIITKVSIYQAGSFDENKKWITDTTAEKKIRITVASNGLFIKVNMDYQTFADLVEIDVSDVPTDYKKMQEFSQNFESQKCKLWTWFSL